MPEPTDRAEVAKLAAAVEAALTEGLQTAYRSDDPSLPSWTEGSRIGTAPAVQQPGRPAMSQRAVDLNTTLISTSVVIVALGGAGSAVLWASGHANPTVIAWLCGCVIAVPVVLAIPVLALKALVKGAKEAVEAAPPAEIHNHYNGPVHQDQRHTHSRTTGLWAKTTNQQ
jgi:hypothetical protein